MTLDEAIKTLQAEIRNRPPFTRDPTPEALQLGIEALKRVESIRLADRVEAKTVLPGETEEVK